ncbi:helix-turn-helix transcriptional regulator [Streptomyces sp. NPDC005900]|uniref:helix-turn-helix domain-containing protein n=1 Tax=Streptomyces sp. NPDC005900 TaxID=3154569 RepID=UPI0033D7643B
MQIARSLQAMRQRVGRTQAEIARRAGVSVGTVNRYMDWRDPARLTVPTIGALADACDATPQERAALVELVRTQADGWWVRHAAVPDWMDPLLSFEDLATYESVYCNHLVPGLLQTRAYALALHRAQEPRAAAEEIERRVDARLKRQDILKRAPDFHLWVVMDEAVLRRRVGDTKVMAGQLDHLQDLSQRPGIDLQVLPFDTGAHAAGAGGHFLMLGRDDVHDPMGSMAVVYLELHRRGVYLDDPEDVQGYKITFDYLRSQAANPARSLDLLADARTEILK